ncbi:hypothetical protein [Motilimonas eburnea]|uniref:hypothetical protein n=1 Tax=Motilimonas eburnea TaxID=1737488 RepID=UPI001E4CC010|nr:hypothetical protein [Motilimonas eburnea]MCE2571774.1 hypothetical protein [Motilimonas eburnea]
MSNKQVPSKKRQSRNTKPRVVRHKLMRIEMPFTSEMLYAFIDRSTTLGIRANPEAAFRRLGVIHHMIIRDKVVKPIVEEWFNQVISDAATSLQEIEAQNAMFGQIPDSGYQITVPESFRLTVEANHPIYLQLANLLHIADKQASFAEDLWYQGVMTDEQKEHCRTQIEHVFSRISSRVAAATNITGRNGGSYSPQEFVKAVREDRVSFDEKVTSAQLNKALQNAQTVDGEKEPKQESDTVASAVEEAEQKNLEDAGSTKEENESEDKAA